MKTATIGLIVTLALGLPAAPLAAEAQQAGKVYRIGYMSIPSRQSADFLIDQVFLPALRERGLVEGKNLMIEWRWAEGKVERLPAFAKELVQLKVDLIVAPQLDSALEAKNVTRTIPIVFLLVADPVGSGLVASLARPGGNLTGLTITPTVEIFAKQLEPLKETLPQASRVAVLRNLARAAVNAPLLREVERATQFLKVALQIVEVRGPEEFGPGVPELLRAPVTYPRSPQHPLPLTEHHMAGERCRPLAEHEPLRVQRSHRQPPKSPTRPGRAL